MDAVPVTTTPSPERAPESVSSLLFPESADLVRSPAWQLAIDDGDFARRDEMRAFRFAQEYAKVDLALRDWRIESTVSIFGSARIPSPEEAYKALSDAELSGDREQVKAAEVKAGLSNHWETARRFARLVSEQGGAKAPYGARRNVIMTGGGPGIMAAANRGAWEAGAPSIGLGITLPHEQEPNPWITPDLCFRFHYFAMRKMHFVARASAVAVFPGGFGTMDELFEVLTLRQTGKSQSFPIIVFGGDWWQKAMRLEGLAVCGMIAHDDLDFLHWVENEEEAWEVMRKAGIVQKDD